MEVNITDNIRITADDHNYILQTRNKLKNDIFSKRKGDLTKWRDYGYYRDIEPLAEDALKLKIWRSDAKKSEEVSFIINSFKIPKTLYLKAHRA